MGITLRKQDVQQKALVNANSEEPMKVRVIPARKKFLPVAQQESVKKRVAAYCRVSSESDEQELSFESQCRFYKNKIDSEPSYDLVDIYADERDYRNKHRKKRRLHEAHERLPRW